MQCLQCGNCCLGLEWTFKYALENEDPDNPSEEILKKAENKLRFYGLLFHQLQKSFVDNGKLALTYKVGVCQHLKFDEGTAHCEIHEQRPFACKDYHCEKAKAVVSNTN